MDATVTGTVDAFTFTVPVGRLAKHEGKKGSLEKAKTLKLFNKLDEAINEKKSYIMDKSMTTKKELVQSQGSRQIYI